MANLFIFNLGESSDMTDKWILLWMTQFLASQNIPLLNTTKGTKRLEQQLYFLHKSSFFLAGQWNCHKRQLTVADINSVSSQWNSEETLVPMHFSLILFQENSFPFNFYWFHFCFKGERKLYTKKIKKGFYCRFRKFEKCISRSFSKPFLSLLIIYLHNNLMYQMPQKKFCN